MSMDPVSNILIGMITLNHWSALDNNWKDSEEDSKKTDEKIEESPVEPADRLAHKCIKHPAAYAAGVVGHGISSFEKIVAVIALFFIDVALTAHYFKPQVTREEVSDQEMEKREIRLILGWIALADAVPSLCVDALVGVFCPPAAYRIHDLIVEKCYIPLFVALQLTDEINFEAFKIKFSPWNLFYLAYSQLGEMESKETSSA